MMKPNHKKSRHSDRLTGLLGICLIYLLTGARGWTATHFVDPSGSLPNDGTSWATAFTNLQDALAVADAGDEIWVAQGTYYPDEGGSSTPDDRDATFNIIDGVALYGGFPTGGGDGTSAARDYVAYPTILSGDLHQDDGPDFTNHEDNSLNVFTANAPVDADSVVDGFIVTAGYQDEWGLGQISRGGGLVCGAASPTIRNCVFQGNHARDGGALFIRDGSPSFDNCSFENNRARQGGALSIGGTTSASLANCSFEGNHAYADGGAVFAVASGKLSFTNCSFSDNSAGTGSYFSYSRGGAVFNWSSSPSFADCSFQVNSADDWGGAICNYKGSSPTFTRCFFEGNAATREFHSPGNASSLGPNGSYGGAIFNNFSSPSLTHCSFEENSSGAAGGAIHHEGGSSSFAHCVFQSNSSLYGGAINVWKGSSNHSSSATFTNCALIDNTAIELEGDGVDSGTGGAAFGGTFYNCTITGNSADKVAGGVFSSALYNCIAYFNSAPSAANYSGSDFNFSCTTPLPTNGVGNISENPQLASASHLSSESPCVGAGSPDYASGADIDGELWLSPPSMGCDEYVPGAATGTLSAALSASYTKVATGFTVEFFPSIHGNVTSNAWDFGDGKTETDQVYGVTHTWETPGTYSVVLRGFNAESTDGVSATVLVHVLSEPLHHVDAGGETPTPPFLSWDTAATNIQDAVDAAYAGGTVLVNDGIYDTGGRAAISELTNRVVVNKPIVLRSVNGPDATVIQGAPGLQGGKGDDAIRCLYLGLNAVLSGFTLSNGHTKTYVNGEEIAFADRQGGGAYLDASATLLNSLIKGNSADLGGGVYGGTLQNCVVTDNSAFYDSRGWGGGTHQSTLYNCTVTGNSAHEGGGVYESTLYNSIVVFNSAPGWDFKRNHSWSTFNYSCTLPLPHDGTGNIINAPLFVNTNDWSDLRLGFGSPGIDAGTNLSASIAIDLKGNPRPLDGDGDGVASFDMGAYEFDARSIVPENWFTSHGLDASDPHVVSGNPDLDPFTTFQEWLADTDPTDGLSFFNIQGISKDPPVAISFRSSANRTYTLWSTGELQSPDWVTVPGQETVRGNGGVMIVSDLTGSLRRFYRVEVNLAGPD